MSTTAIVILNWNGVDFLTQFLPTLITHSGGYEIIVADNASSDNSVLFLQQNYPDVKIINNASNGGFAKGYNDSLHTI